MDLKKLKTHEEKYFLDLKAILDAAKKYRILPCYHA